MGDDLAVGIDLGTTQSVVAVRDKDGKPQTLPSAEGDLTTPSVVYFHPSAVVVGKEAVKAAVHEPEMVIHYAKRDMGKDAVGQLIRGHRLPPEVIQALILKKLKADATLKLGPFSRAVITVPAYFNEPRRKATQDAGRLAGLEVLDIINEPTAAAIAYGVQQGFLDARGEATHRELVLVYDLGGGTFDATLMELHGHDYRAIATAGDVYLGGIDWNQRIANHVAERFKKEHGLDPREDRESYELLMLEAEDAKRGLTSREQVTVHFAHDGRRCRVPLTRAEFETLTEDLLQRTLFTIQKMIREVKVGWEAITRILLVGGSTRMPMIHKMLARESGRTLDRSLSPDEAVAHGAALYADFLVHGGEAHRPRASVVNVNSHDLGILAIETETRRRRRRVMIPRNSALPATGVGHFVTSKDNQANVVVHVIEGGDASGNHATAIGKCTVRDLPPGLPAKTPVEVKFAYAPNGRLTVEAWLPTADRQATMTIERTAGLSDAMLDKWQASLEDDSLLRMLFAEETVEENLLDHLDEMDDDALVLDELGSANSRELDPHDSQTIDEDIGLEMEAEADEDVDDDDLKDFLQRFR